MVDRPGVVSSLSPSPILGGVEKGKRDEKAPDCKRSGFARSGRYGTTESLLSAHFSKTLAQSIDGEALFSLSCPCAQPPNQIIHLDRLALDRFRRFISFSGRSMAVVLFEVASEGARGEERIVPAPADKGDPIRKGKRRTVAWVADRRRRERE